MVSPKGGHVLEVRPVNAGRIVIQEFARSLLSSGLISITAFLSISQLFIDARVSAQRYVKDTTTPI